MIIFDFDRVLFDTDRFTHDLEESFGGHRTIEVFDQMTQAGVDLRSYVRDGVEEYFAEHPDEAGIVSSYISHNRGDNTADPDLLERFQEEKIKRSGLAAAVKGKVRVTAEDKTEDFEKFKEPGKQNIVIDDEAFHVRTARELGFIPIWFRTPKNIKGELEGRIEYVEGAYQVTSIEQCIELLNKKPWEK